MKARSRLSFETPPGGDVQTYTQGDRPAKTTTESKLKDFDIQSMSNKIQSLAPGLCVVFDALLEANPALSYKWNWARQKVETSGLSWRQRKTAKTTDGNIDMHDVTSKTSENIVDDDEYWKLFDQEEISLIDNEDDKPEGIEEVIEEQQLKLNRFNLIPA